MSRRRRRVWAGRTLQYAGRCATEPESAVVAAAAAARVLALRGVQAPLAFSYVHRFSMALLYGRAGRLTAKNGGFRPGQYLEAERGGRGAVEGAEEEEVRRITAHPGVFGNK